MRRFLTAVLLAFSSLGLATSAHADRGGNLRDRGGDQFRQRDNDTGLPQGDTGARDQGKDRRDRGDQLDQNGGRDDDRQWFSRRREHDRAREGVIRGRMISLEDLENRISRRMSGYRIGNPEFLMFGGRPVYRIRWRKPDGRVLIVFADAETGQIIDIRGR